MTDDRLVVIGLLVENGVSVGGADTIRTVICHL